MGFSSQIRRRTRRLKPLVSRRSSAFLTEKALASDDLLNIALARIHRTGGWYQLCSPHWTQPVFPPAIVLILLRIFFTGDATTVVTLAELGQKNLLVSLISPSAINFSPVSQPNNQWGILVFLAIFLKFFDGFIKSFTETELLLRDYLSLSKSLSFVHLPVDSSGSSPSSFASSLRSAFPPIFEWRSLSISIAVLLSCVAVRSGPEDTTDFVSTIFRGADWMLTSRYTVTISQGFGNVVNFVLTHPSVALDSLSYYLRAFAIFYVVLSFVWRVLNNFPFNCNLDLDV